MFSKTLVNCTVYSGEDQYDSITFNEKILSLGGEAKGENVIDMNGAAIVPGFVDSHAHLYHTAMKIVNVDLTGMSRKETIKALSESTPSYNGWVVARGWDESEWDSTEFLNPEEIENDHPLLAVRVDGHMAILNKEGMERCRTMGINFGSDGVILESDLNRLQSQVKPEFSIKDAIQRAEEFCLSKGVTTVSDITGIENLNLYESFDHRLRVVFNPIGQSDPRYKTGDRVSDNLYMGHVKLFADGSVGARTAAMSEGYRDSDANPDLLHSDSQLKSLYHDFKSEGYRVMTHAIGDLAVNQVIRTIKEIGGSRMKIEHNEFVLPLREEMEEKDMIVSMQPNFLRWSFPGGLYEKRLGSGYLSLNNRFGSLIKNGARVSFGSDSMPLDPVYGIKLAINPPTSGQKLSLDQAIKCYTENSAYALNLENETGKIEKGFEADIVALKRSDMSVAKTFFGGKEVFGKDQQ